MMFFVANTKADDIPLQEEERENVSAAEKLAQFTPGGLTTVLHIASVC